ncbi:MAG: 3-hydroxyacyl-CoA dehydrogenase NAD-binding domain-containing protein, partial [Alphaproteobacteria bacterium]
MIEKIGVIGAGQMGNGIAHVCALAGHETLLMDVSTERVHQALETIEANLSRQVSRGKISEDEKTAALERIKPVSDYGELADCDLVIESATENEEVKREIFKKVSAVLKPEGLMATNTSSISVTRLGSVTDRPGKFVGMHFMNPVPVMKLVELIRGLATDEDTYQAVRELTVELGKNPVNA